MIMDVRHLCEDCDQVQNRKTECLSPGELVKRCSWKVQRVKRVSMFLGSKALHANSIF